MKTLALSLALVLVAALAAVGQDADATTRERLLRIQTDTNATTSVTLYTAPGAGALLSGKVGNTNAVWIATAAGTNSWVKIAQQ